MTTELSVTKWGQLMQNCTKAARRVQASALPTGMEKEAFARLVLEHQASLEGLTLEEARSRRKTERHVAVRQRTVKILCGIPYPDGIYGRGHRHGLYSLTEVGEAIGGRDHTTVMYLRDSPVHLDIKREWAAEGKLSPEKKRSLTPRQAEKPLEWRAHA